MTSAVTRDGVCTLQFAMSKLVPPPAGWNEAYRVPTGGRKYVGSARDILYMKERG